LTAALILSESGANCVSTMMRPSLPTTEGDPIPPNTLAELRRDMERRRLVKDQIRQIEAARLERLEDAPCAGPHAMVRLLARVIGVGIETADMLVHEVLSRNMRDRRAVAQSTASFFNGWRSNRQPASSTGSSR
jgi:hypothetical protein